mgnify:CR=1 FL=1
MFLTPNRFAGVLTLALALACGSLPSQAAAAGLTLAESERIAIDRHAMLRDEHQAGAEYGGHTHRPLADGEPLAEQEV